MWVQKWQRGKQFCCLKRWNRRKRKDIDVAQIVLTEYNKYIGGVDLLDSLAYLHRIPLRSKQHRVIWNFLRMSLVPGIGRKGFNQHATMDETPNMT